MQRGGHCGIKSFNRVITDSCYNDQSRVIYFKVTMIGVFSVQYYCLECCQERVTRIFGMVVLGKRSTYFYYC